MKGRFRVEEFGFETVLMGTVPETGQRSITKVCAACQVICLIAMAVPRPSFDPD